MDTLKKNPVIGGFQFKSLYNRSIKRVTHVTQVDGLEIGIAFSNLDPLVTGKPLGWYWDKQRVGTSRETQTYFETAEAAFEAARAAQ